MMVDMLNYGAAAQVNFNYNTADLANSQLTDEQKAWGSATVETTTNTRVEGEYYKGTRLALENNIQMHMAFEGLDETMYAVYSYTNHYGKTTSVTVKGEDFMKVGSLYGIEVKQLTCADARQTITVQIFDANGELLSIVIDSIESYVNRSGAEQPLFDALMKFADSAYAYLHQ